ncbi:hypothetical protein D3C86_1909910 [compost metagenome]
MIFPGLRLIGAKICSIFKTLEIRQRAEDLQSWFDIAGKGQPFGFVGLCGNHPLGDFIDKGRVQTRG